MNFPPDTRSLVTSKSKPRIGAAEGSPPFVGMLLTSAYLGIRLDSFANRTAPAHFVAGKESIGIWAHRIAGHRDGSIPGRKDAASSDTIELETPDPTSMVGTPSLGLVICYAFYLAGDAAMRHIVSASLDEEVPEKNNLGLARLQKPRKEEPRHE